jgi:hypothetical protein
MNKAERYFLLPVAERNAACNCQGGGCWCSADGQMGVGACAGPTVENTAVCLLLKTCGKMKPVQGEMRAACQV